MKRTTRTVEISVKTDEFLVIKKSPRLAPQWCAQCAKQVGMVPLEELGHFAGVLDRVGDGRIHLTETPEGSLLICLVSLAS